MTRWSTRCEPLVVATSIPEARCSIEVTSVARWTSPPAASMSSPKAPATATKSVIAVAGECRAATPVAWGSTSWIPVRSSRRRPGTPLREALCSNASRRCELGGLDRDDELAALDVRQRLLQAVVTQQQPPAGAQLGLQTARRVVDAGVHDAGVVPGLVRGEPVLLLEDVHAGPRIPARELATHGQADDAAPDHPEAAHPPSRPCGAPDPADGGAGSPSDRRPTAGAYAGSVSVATDCPGTVVRWKSPRASSGRSTGWPPSRGWRSRSSCSTSSGWGSPPASSSRNAWSRFPDHGGGRHPGHGLRHPAHAGPPAGGHPAQARRDPECPPRGRSLPDHARTRTGAELRRAAVRHREARETSTE